jgi:phosphatidylglycerophosphate synthase
MVSLIPNMLSMGRMALGLCFPWLPLSWRVPMVVVAALTDLLDGALGRLFHVCGRTGRVLDPLADKVFVAGMIITFLGDGVLTVGEVLLVGLRDLTVIIGTIFGLALRQWAAFRRISPTWLSKATTVAQFVFFGVLLVAPGNRGLAFGTTAILSTVAAGHYLWLFLRHRSQETLDVPQGYRCHKIRC